MGAHELVAGMSDEQAARDQLEEAAAMMAAEAALAYVRDGMAAELLDEWRAAGFRGATEVGDADGAALEQDGRSHPANLVSRARPINRQQDIEQGQSGSRHRAFERKQAALGDDAVVGRDLVEAAAGVEHAMAWHDQGIGIFRQGVCHRMQSARDMQMRRDLIMNPGFAAWDATEIVIDPLIEWRDIRHIEMDVREIDVLSTQRGDDSIDGSRNARRRPQFTGFRKQLEQAPERLDLSCFRQLHADHTCFAPRDAATAERRLENGVPTPHSATPTPRYIISLADQVASEINQMLTMMG
jgi:hypothetical protein